VPPSSTLPADLIRLQGVPFIRGAGDDDLAQSATASSTADPLELSDRLHAVGRLVDAGLLATLQIDMGDDTAAVAEVLGRAKAEIEELAEEVGRLQRPAA
jgi:hypothetical protein